MLVLASDFSGVVTAYYIVAVLFSLLNVGLFLAYYAAARPRGLPRPFPKLLVLAALSFTIVGPIGFVQGPQLLGPLGLADIGGSAFVQLIMAGVPSVIGSLWLVPFLQRDIPSGLAWLAPLLGIVPTLVLAALTPDVRSGAMETLNPFLWSIPWHVTCAVAFMTAGRRAWKAELLSKSACPTCGYSRQGLATSTCPECGGSLSD